jgi:peptidoglycan/LPS O-acetylase OafA/YrhL
MTRAAPMSSGSHAPREEAPAPRIWREAHVPALDGIRGLAAAMVAIAHASGVIAMTGGLDSVIGAFAMLGDYGVDAFLALSGLLITTILLDGRTADGRLAPGFFRAFYLRRALRILPLYYLAVALLLLVLPRTGLPTAEEVARLKSDAWWYVGHGINILYFLRPDPTTFAFGTVHLWTLALEEQFYLLWPMVVAFCSPRTLWRVCVGLIALAPVVRATAIVVDAGLFVDKLLPGRCDALAIGALLALVRKGWPGVPVWHRAPTPAQWQRWSLLAFAASIAVRGAAPAHHPVTTALAHPAIAVLTAAVATQALNGQQARGPLARGLLPWLGRYSYAVYIVHLPVIVTVFRLAGMEMDVRAAHGGVANRLGFFVVVLAVAAILAFCSWHLWERPWLSLKRFVPRPVDPLTLRVRSASQAASRLASP